MGENSSFYARNIFELQSSKKFVQYCIGNEAKTFFSVSTIFSTVMCNPERAKERGISMEISYF